MTIGGSKEFAYRAQNEEERDRLVNYVRFKNTAAFDQLKSNMMANIEYAGLENADFMKTFTTATDMSYQMGRGTSMTNKQTVRMYDNLELFNREDYPVETTNKLRRIEKEKDMFAMEGTVFDRLYKDSVLKSVVSEEKQIILRELENNKRMKEMLSDGSVLCKLVITIDDINGTSLIQDKQSGRTYIDLNRTVSRINMHGQVPSKSALPSLMTSIDDTAIDKLMQEYTKIECNDRGEQMIPVDLMKGGMLGVNLTSLARVVKAIYDQMYSVKQKVSKTTQTLTHNALLEVQRRMRIDDYQKLATGATFQKKSGDFALKKVILPSRKALQKKIIDFNKTHLHQSFNHGFYTDRPGRSTSRTAALNTTIN